MSLPIASIGGADLFGLVVSVLICGYLLYALLRGERF
jgi:K+-transporting ATPase KdpF subunit